jgi:hypothetical protein
VAGHAITVLERERESGRAMRDEEEMGGRERKGCGEAWVGVRMRELGFELYTS